MDDVVISKARVADLDGGGKKYGWEEVGAGGTHCEELHLPGGSEFVQSCDMRAVICAL